MWWAATGRAAPWPLAHFRFFRSEGSRRAQLRHSRPVRLSYWGTGVSCEEIHPDGRGHRFGDRCPCDIPAMSSRASPRGHASFLLPRKGRYGLCDYEKMFCPDLDSGNDIFTMRSIDRAGGCLEVV